MGQIGHLLQEVGRGAPHAVNPPSNKTPPIRILGSTLRPLRFPSKTRVRRIAFRIADGLPYGLIVEADYIRNEETILDFGPGKGFKHSQNAPSIPLSRSTIGGVGDVANLSPFWEGTARK